MHVIIVGCGIAGLACAIGFRKYGHQVTILERASQVSPIGSGINISPNASKALRTLGVLDQVLQHSYLPEHASIRSYDTSELLSRQRLGNLMWELYDAPFLVIHRYELYSVLYDEACAIGVQILFSRNVTSFETNTPSVITSDGKFFSGDLVIGADGEKSVCREAVLGRPVIPTDSGIHVFRLTIPKTRVSKIPHISYLVDHPCINLVLGPGGPSMIYCVKYGDLLNIVLAKQHDMIENPPELPHAVELSMVEQEFEGWTLIQDLLGLADSCIRWTLIDSEPLERWALNKTVLIGDACHVMTPFVGQGAAMAIEDAVILSALVGNLTDHSGTLQAAINEFYTLRRGRIDFLQEKAVILYQDYAYPKGPEQEARDRRLKDEMLMLEAFEAAATNKKLSDTFAKNSTNFLADVEFRNIIFGYDAEKISKEACIRMNQIERK